MPIDPDYARIKLDMEDTAKGLAFSYIVELPRPEATVSVEAQKVEWVKGEFGFRFKEVFEDYYFQSLDKGVDIAPYILFAETPPNTKSIIDFTNKFGPLHHPKNLPPGSGFNPRIFTERELEDLHRRFWFTPSWWRKQQDQFKQQIADLSRTEWATWETGTRVLLPGASTFTFEMVRQKDALIPQIRSGTLIEALWLMLWNDTANGGQRVRICANQRCTKIFRCDRSDQIYCCERCKELVNKRKNWHRKGEQARQNRRLDKKLPRADVHGALF
jgi:hypothetical protein